LDLLFTPAKLPLLYLKTYSAQNIIHQQSSCAPLHFYQSPSLWRELPQRLSCKGTQSNALLMTHHSYHLREINNTEIERTAHFNKLPQHTMTVSVKQYLQDFLQNLIKLLLGHSCMRAMMQNKTGKDIGRIRPLPARDRKSKRQDKSRYRARASQQVQTAPCRGKERLCDK
jgi:hypothetical protein